MAWVALLKCFPGNGLELKAAQNYAIGEGPVGQGGKSEANRSGF